jgi:antitoxin component YwqK of YwqJK toxin-antitoxin module
MKTKNIYFVLLLILFSSCKEKIKREYYDTGELKFEERYLSNYNDSNFYVTRYFRNGKIQHEGLIRNDSIREGHWKMYFDDGVLKWEGDFKNSVIQHQQYSKNWTWPNMRQYFKHIEIEGHPNHLIKDRIYNFRVIMPQIHPNLYAVLDSNFQTIFNPNNSDSYQYRIQPKKSGVDFINILFMNKDGFFIVGNPMLRVAFNVYDK